MFASSREIGRIPVLAILGAPGSGKTYFLNQLLAYPALANSVVLTASADQQLKHSYARVEQLASLGEPSVSGCLCCDLKSDLGDALRNLFLQALAKKIAPIDRLIIEANTIDPDPLKLTLKHAPFLGQRYVFQSSFLVLDAADLLKNIHSLEGFLEGWGVEKADYVVFARADFLSITQRNEAVLAVKQLNSKAKAVVSNDMLEALLANTLH